MILLAFLNYHVIRPLHLNLSELAEPPLALIYNMIVGAGYTVLVGVYTVTMKRIALLKDVGARSLKGMFIIGDELYCLFMGGEPFEAISKYDKESFEWIDGLSLGIGNDNINGYCIVGNKLYTAHHLGPARMVKTDLPSFSYEAYVECPAGRNLGSGVVSDGTYLYMACNHSIGYVVKIQISDFSYVTSLALAIDEQYPRALAIDGGYLYVGCCTYPAKIVKIDLGTFSAVATLTLLAGENCVSNFDTFLIAGGYLYVGLSTDIGKIAKVRLSDFTRDAVLTFHDDEGYVYSLLREFNYLYATSDCTEEPYQGIIIRVDLNTFTEIDRIDLLEDETSPSPMLMV